MSLVGTWNKKRTRPWLWIAGQRVATDVDGSYVVLAGGDGHGIVETLADLQGPFMPYQQQRLIRSRDVRLRYNDISDRTLCRWERSPTMGFPKPLIINKRKFWNEDELDEFDAARLSAG